ncbi:MAG: hypothetical protein ACOC2N_08550 [Spirochaetota bacterium]
MFMTPKLPIAAMYVEEEEFGFVLDLPIGWEQADYDADEMLLDGVGDDESEVDTRDLAAEYRFVRDDLDARLYIGARDELSTDALLDVGAELVEAEGDAAWFEYQGRDAFFADVTMGGERSGYMIAVPFGDYSGVLFVSAPEGQRSEADEELLSIADAFAPIEPYSGPVTVFFEDDGSADETVELHFPGPSARGAVGAGSVELSYSPMAIESGSVLVGREAEILASHEHASHSGGDGTELSEESDDDPEWLRSWRRYFRLLYRDNYERLDGLAEQIAEYMNAHSVPDEKKADLILSWLQAFEFRQSPNAGLFQPPVESLTTVSGDCDSLALIYTILLSHFDIDSRILVSVEHGHAVALVEASDASEGEGRARGRAQGVATDGSTESTRFTIDGQEYLPAEMTASWPLSVIASEQTEADDWHLVTPQTP